MLVEKSNISGQSKYICDMCKKNIEENPTKIYVGNGTDGLRKEWDLCNKDFKLLKHNVNIWHSRLEKKKEA